MASSKDGDGLYSIISLLNFLTSPNPSLPRFYPKSPRISQPELGNLNCKMCLLLGKKALQYLFSFHSVCSYNEDLSELSRTVVPLGPLVFPSSELGKGYILCQEQEKRNLREAPSHLAF